MNGNTCGWFCNVSRRGLLLGFLLAFGIGTQARGAAYTSVTDGAWTNPATWGEAVLWPSEPDDTATVSHRVRINTDLATIAGIAIATSGNLEFARDTALDTTQAITMATDAMLSTAQVTHPHSPNHRLRGTIAIDGNAYLKYGLGTLRIDSVISGTGDITLQRNYWNHDSTGPSFLFGDNTYSGGTRLVANAWDHNDRIRLGSDTGFGTGPVWLDSTTSYPRTLMLTASVTLANDIRGQGRVNSGAGAHSLTLTGSLSPYDTGLTNTVEVVGPQTAMLFIIDRLLFGTETVGATYNWQYNATTNDWVQCEALTFGTAPLTLHAEWLGDGDPDMGVYTLFTFTGTPPVSPNWTVHAPPKRRGRVRVDADGGKVVLELDLLPPSGTVIRIR